MKTKISTIVVSALSPLSVAEFFEGSGNRAIIHSQRSQDCIYVGEMPAESCLMGHRQKPRKHESLPHDCSRLRRHYAAFFCPAFSFAHLAFCATAIFFRADADIVCFAGRPDANFAAPGIDCDPFPAFAHLALCANAIFLREAADMIRFGWFPFRDAPERFSDSITEIA